LASNPAYQAHKTQALHNFKFVQSLSPANPQFPDWAITGMFYMALHCVNAHAAKGGWKWRKYQPRDPAKISVHTQTLRYVRNRLGINLFKDYLRLYQECWSARYDPLFVKKMASQLPTRLFTIAKNFLNIA